MMLEKLIQLEATFEKITQLLSDPAVIANQSQYQKHAKTHRDLSEVIEKFHEYKKLKKDLKESNQIAQDDSLDIELKTLALDEISQLNKRISVCDKQLQILLLPRDPNDEKNVLLEIRAGTGGNEATLFAQEMFRMYNRFAEAQNWKVELMSSSISGVGGIKEVIAIIEGKNVYSKLKFESGVHRVQRVPTTETSGRVHTSAITVAVLPEADEVEIKIQEKDLRIDRFCSSGPGGQSVNTTYSAVRITHLPTGLIVTCQDEKSQIKNKAKAMRVLRSRLNEVAMEDQRQAIATDRKNQIGGGDRSEKIRTYNYPQNRLTDHRISLTLHRLETVIDGDLGMVIEPLLTYFQEKQLEEELESI